MTNPGDNAFVGSIPATYEERLVPLLFQPYAVDLAERVARTSPRRVLELAAGTGALTRELAARLPEASIVATDLNQAMLDVAARVIKDPNVHFETCDACAPPYGDGSFDAVTAQFGVMLFPDKGAAYAHAHRILAAGGAFTFNTWNMLPKNLLANAIAKAYRAAAGDQACSLERVPFAYFDPALITSELEGAGFADIHIDTVAKTTKAHSAAAVLDAMVAGSPLGADFDQLGRDRGAHVREAIFEALVSTFGDDEFDNVMSALVIQAQKTP